VGQHVHEASVICWLCADVCILLLVRDEEGDQLGSSLGDKQDIEIARYWGGYDRGKPRIRIRGVPRRRCLRRPRRVRIRISDLSALSRVHVRLDGRRLRATRKRRFSIRLRPSGCAPGAIDSA